MLGLDQRRRDIQEGLCVAMKSFRHRLQRQRKNKKEEKKKETQGRRQ